MIRLPSSHAAITAPLPASTATFPGIPIGRSVLDRRTYSLSPALVDQRILPSTNSLALGGLGSGKSTTDKVQILREIRMHDHQAVIIDSFGENKGGEWGALTEAVGGKIVRAGEFSLNPCSPLLPAGVPEELIRSLIAAVEPHALTPHAAYAIQQAVKHPKATTLNGVVDALVHPEDGHRWPAAQLEVWGVEAVFALSRYTEGSLTGLFDGEGATLPPTDLPVITFDFSSLDRNSAAIPSLMAAVSVWVEHVWLPQSTADHRHLVLEEAWQILRDPATTELIQRLLKNSRKTGLSLHALMHTLSDLGEGRAQDLAKLCEIAHVGRLAPEEAAIVGSLLGLPDWAIAEIPNLEPGEAVWKVGPHSVDIVKTLLTEQEALLTDTSSRRRKAQQRHTSEAMPEAEEKTEGTDQDTEPEQYIEAEAEAEQDHGDAPFTPIDYLLAPPAATDSADDWDWDMPSTVVDRRHYDVVQAAREGRYSEAAELAVIGERHDIRSHGINSDAALSWLSTRAKVADLSGSTNMATQLRATVTRMGKDVEWWDKEPDNGAPQPERYSPPPPVPVPAPASASAPDDGHGQAVRTRRRTWPYVAVVAALVLTTVGVWQRAEADRTNGERQQKAAAYKGKSGARLMVDDVNADVIARWTKDREHVIVELSSYFDPDAKYLRIDAAGTQASSSLGNDRFPKDPQVKVPISDPLADLTVRLEIGGTSWKEGTPGTVRTVRLSPTGVAYDAETGDELPRN